MRGVPWTSIAKVWATGTLSYLLATKTSKAGPCSGLGIVNKLPFAELGFGEERVDASSWLDEQWKLANMHVVSQCIDILGGVFDIDFTTRIN